MNWTAVSAIATVVIAGVAVLLVVAALVLIRRLMLLTGTVQGFVQTLERDARPALESAKSLIGESHRVAIRLTDEVKEIADTTQDVRLRLVGAVDRIEDRLVDLDTLVDVIQGEVEETVLDVGAALRTTRKGGALVGSVRRLLFGKSKRRKRRRR